MAQNVAMLAVEVRWFFDGEQGKGESK